MTFDTDFLSKLHSYFPTPRILDDILSEVTMAPSLSNDFMNFDLETNLRTQSILSDIMMAVIEYSFDGTSYFMISPESSDAIHFPVSPASISRLHRHEYFEMIYILSGELDFMIEGTHKRYRSGDCCIINQKVRHVEGYQTHFTAVYLSFRMEFIRRLHFSVNAKHSPELVQFLERNIAQNVQADSIDFSPSVTRDMGMLQSQVSTYLGMILSEMVTQETGFIDVIAGYTKRLFAFLLSPQNYICNNTRFYRHERSELFEQILFYIHEQKRRVTRKEIATVLHYNGNYISDVFLEHTGMTLAVYIRDVCLQESTYLLLNTNMTISEIIRQIGFENRTSFYHQFYDKYRMAPGEYRKRQR